jgi:hypothetical protein
MNNESVMKINNEMAVSSRGGETSINKMKMK